MVQVGLVILVLINIGFTVFALSKLREQQNLIAQRVEHFHDLLDNYLDDWCAYIQLNCQRIQQTQNRISELKELCKKLENNIKDIPKEITVRNVLKLP